MSDKTSVLKGPKSVMTKVRTWARTQTTGTQVAVLPKGSRLLGFVLGGVASDDSGTATISIGTNSTATQWVNAASVKTTAGVGPTNLAMVSGIFGSVLTVDTPVYFKYAGQNADATVGGGKVAILYTQSNVVNDDTI